MHQRDGQHAFALATEIVTTSLAVTGPQIVHPGQPVGTHRGAAHTASPIDQPLGFLHMERQALLRDQPHVKPVVGQHPHSARLGAGERGNGHQKALQQQLQVVVAQSPRRSRTPGGGGGAILRRVDCERGHVVGWKPGGVSRCEQTIVVHKHVRIHGENPKSPGGSPDGGPATRHRPRYPSG
ncbi:hypothetical protein FQZ97_1032890 [compost metagenome]